MCLERTSGSHILLTSHSSLVKDSPGNLAGWQCLEHPHPAQPQRAVGQEHGQKLQTHSKRGPNLQHNELNKKISWSPFYLDCINRTDCATVTWQRRKVIEFPCPTHSNMLLEGPAKHLTSIGKIYF